MSPVCGSEISPTQKIECKPCPPGKFSNTYDSAPCQSCHECVTHEVVASNCTRLSDRKCSGTCRKGYYFVKKAPHIHSCQQCSYCCFDGKDVIQEECVTQGLNATNRHCSQQKSKKCAPKPRPATNLPSESTSRSSPSSTSSSSSLLSSSSTTGPPKNHKNNILKIVVGVLVGVVAALVGTIFYFCRWIKAKLETNTPKASGPSQANNILPINGENVQQKTERPS